MVRGELSDIFCEEGSGAYSGLLAGSGAYSGHQTLPCSGAYSALVDYKLEMEVVHTVGIKHCSGSLLVGGG